MAKKTLIFPIIITSALMLGACDQAPKTLSLAEVEEFSQIYDNQSLTWNAGYLILSVTGLDYTTPAKPLAGPNAILDRYVKGFYIALNSNSTPEFKDGKFIAPHFAEFAQAAKTCQVALKYPEQMNKLTQISDNVEKFCRNTTFYYKLMVESFSADQVASLNAWSLKRYIPTDKWVELVDGKYGFTYALPTTADLTKSNLSPYVTK